jgi:hypothetical protein
MVQRTRQSESPQSQGDGPVYLNLARTDHVDPPPPLDANIWLTAVYFFSLRYVESTMVLRKLESASACCCSLFLVGTSGNYRDRPLLVGDIHVLMQILCSSLCPEHVEHAAKSAPRLW